MSECIGRLCYKRFTKMYSSPETLLSIDANLGRDFTNEMNFVLT